MEFNHYRFFNGAPVSLGLGKGSLFCLAGFFWGIREILIITHQHDCRHLVVIANI